MFRRNVISIFILVTFSGCSLVHDSELEQAAKAVGIMLRPMRFQKSCFNVLHPAGKPSEFITFMFSDAGVAEWPDGEYEFGFPEMVHLNPNVRKVGVEKQIVIKANDADGEIVVEAYGNYSEKPAFIKRYQIPRIAAPPGLESLCRRKV